jgi:hypothetical protein
LHAVDDIGKECDHVVVAHGHVCNNPFQSNLLGRIVLVFLAADGLKLSPELRYFTLLMNERLTCIITTWDQEQIDRNQQPQLRKGDGGLTLVKSLASCPELIVADGVGKSEFNRSEV